MGSIPTYSRQQFWGVGPIPAPFFEYHEKGSGMDHKLLRQIPKTDVLLERPALSLACADFTRAQVRGVVQAVLSEVRGAILDGSCTEAPTPELVEALVIERLRKQGVYSLRPVVNATGVVLHTNLGRAPLGPEVAAHVAEVAQGYCNLEYNIEAGERGQRYKHVEHLICELCGSESAMVVNNNASAVFLMLNSLCEGGKVAVSRGELVEIGGSFRVPDIMTRSGCELVEIGTTNKTHESDYNQAANLEGMSALLKVHTSNFKIIGFTEEVEPREMATIAHNNKLLAFFDLGSALPVNPELLGLHQGMSVKEPMAQGVDVACFSGDKLLGGAQAGILIGKRELIAKIRSNPLARMVRIDKLSLAALEMTLLYCLDPQTAKSRVTTIHMLSLGPDECEARAQALLAKLQAAAPAFDMQAVSISDEPGGGSMPGVELAGAAVAVQASFMSAQELEGELRAWEVPIIARIRDGQVLLSVRTLTEKNEDVIAAALHEIATLAAEGATSTFARRAAIFTSTSEEH